MLEDILKLPPHASDIEQALLSSILTNQSSYEKVSDFLKPEHFYHEDHKVVYKIIQDKRNKNENVDGLVIKDNSSLDDEYIIGLINASVSMVNVLEYGKLIHDRYLRRKAIELGQDLINNSYEIGEPTALEIVEKHEQNISSMNDTQADTTITLSDSIKAVDDIILEAYKRGGALSGYSTGYHDLDKILNGLNSPDLLIFAGASSMGKTAFAVNVAYNLAKQNIPVAFFSLEMSHEQLTKRMISMESGISGYKLNSGNLDNNEWELYGDTKRTIEDLPIHIDDGSGVNINNIRTRCRRLVRSKGVKAIFVDYLQLIDPLSSNGNRVQEVAAISRGLKMIAKELNVPVIALSQVNRGVDNRDDKRPKLGDLRESGSIEQDADIVCFVYREFYYLEREQNGDIDRTNDANLKRMQYVEERIPQVRDRLDIIVAKQRHGTTGTIQLRFIGENVKIENR